MARTPSTMLDLGTPAPDFHLLNPATGDPVSLSEVRGAKATVVMFLCNHCPFVTHVRDEITRIAADYGQQGVGFVAINANDVANYPDDAPESMAELAGDLGWQFPFLFDDDQSVAQSYRAACTPDFFVFDADATLAYRGQMDGARPGNDVANDGRDLRAAIDALLAGARPDQDQRPSLGCNIKWKPGNEPQY